MVTQYEIYGLAVASEIQLPEMWSIEPEAARPTEIEIRLGQTPLCVHDDCERTGEYEVGAAGILLNLPDVGRFWAVGGHTLTVTPAPGADMDLVRLFVLGSGLAAILHQRGEFPLHASAHDGRCYVFLGESGSGKSTLAGMLAQRGFSIVSDDVLVVAMPDAEAGAAMTAPGIPVLKLWPESAQASGFEDAGVPYEAYNVRKHRISASSAFTRQALPVAKLYGLNWSQVETEPPRIAPIGNFDAVKLIRANVYRNNLIHATQREAAFACFAATLVRSARAFEFHRDKNFVSADAHLDAIEQHIRSV